MIIYFILTKVMMQLNLPPIEAKLKTENGRPKVWDTLRLQYVALTPEEWVRQHFISFLINHKSYNQAMMANEVSITLNGMSRRCDSVLYDGNLRPRMIIEYKRPNVPIGQKVFNQISRYNLVMQVDYLIVSNGMKHYCCKMDYANQTYQFLQDIPQYLKL